MNKLLSVIITVVIGIIFLGSILAPVINDASETSKSFENTGSGYYSYISSEDTYSLTWTYDNPTKVTVNGTELSAIPGNEALAMGDFTVRVQPSATGYCQFISPDGGATSNASDNATFSMTYEDGTLTIVAKSGTVTMDVDGFYALTETGEYTMKSSSATAYMNANTPLLVIGVTNVGGQWNTGYMVEGTVTNYTVSQWNGTTTYPISNITDDVTPVNGYSDLYTVKAFQWDADNSGTAVHCTYNYFLVPTTVTGEYSEHLDAASIAILAAIPIMIIAALIMFTIRFFTGRD